MLGAARRVINLWPSVDGAQVSWGRARAAQPDSGPARLAPIDHTGLPAETGWLRRAESGLLARSPAGRMDGRRFNLRAEIRAAQLQPRLAATTRRRMAASWLIYIYLL